MTATRLIRRLMLGACVWAMLPLTGLAADAKKKINYEEHILPLMREKCLACHNADKQSGGLDMSTYPKLMEGGASGIVVKSGDPDASRMYTLTAHTEEPKMPPKSARIADESIALLKSWIIQGALEKGTSKPVAIKPKADVSLTSVTRGRPEGAPPMPTVKLRLDPVVVAARPNAVIALAASPWAPLVAVGGQKQVLLYNTDTLQLVGVLPFAHGMPTVLKFSRNGSLLLAGGGRGGSSGKVVVWNIKSGETIIEVGNETDSVMAADISPDQTLIALGGPSKMVRIYSTKDGTIQREIKKHTDWIYSLEFSPDGVLLSTGDRQGGLFVWEADTGREFYSMRGHTGGICGASWRDDSNVLATTSEDGSIRLWEMENGSNFKTWVAHGGGSQSVQFSHDNRLVSTGRDKTPKLWDQNGGQQKAFEATADVGLRVAITHENAKLIATDWTGTVRVFNIVDGKLLGTLNPNPPTLADQVVLAGKDLVIKQTAFDAANAAHVAANANLKRVNDELAAAQANVTKTAAEAKQAVDAVPVLKTAVDQTTAKLNAAKQAQQAATVKSQQLAAVAQKATVDAVEAKKQLDAAAVELVAVQKLVTDTDALLKSQTTAHTAAVTLVTTRQAEAKQAVDAVPALKTAVDQTTAKLTAAKAQLQVVTVKSQQLAEAAKKAPTNADAKKAADAAVAEVVAVTKVVADTDVLLKTQTAAYTAGTMLVTTRQQAAQVAIQAVPALKTAVDQTTAKLNAAKTQLQAVTVKSQQLTAAHAKAQVAIVDTKKLADESAAQVVVATKAVTDLDAMLKQQAAAYAAGVALVAPRQQAAAAAVQAVPPRQAAIKPAMDAIPPTKVNLDKAAADLAIAKAFVEMLKSTPVAAK